MLLVVLHCGQDQQTPSKPDEDLRRSIIGIAYLFLFIILITPIFPFIIIMLIMDIPYYNIRYLPCTVAGSCKQSFTPKITDNTPCPTSHHC